jgi:hypothetical protein
MALKQQEESNVISPDAWLAKAAEGTGVTTEELDRRAKEYSEAYARYEEQKKISSKLHEEAEVLEGKMVEAMELAGKRKYHVEGLGLFFFRDQMVVTTPKTTGDKKKLLTWLRKTFGETVYLDKVSVNHQTLQSIYNKTFEEYVEQGKDAATFHIPGLQPPTNRRSLSFKGEK